MRVAIIGLGYVGLPLAVAFARVGIDVVAVDADPGRVAAVRAGESYVEDVPSADLVAARERLHPTTDTAEAGTADAVLICVPTPLNRNREPSLEALDAVGAALGEVLRAGQVVVLESTSYPGTTRERLRPLLERSGLTAGEDFHLAYSPERVDPGRSDWTLRTTPKLLGGLTPACTAAARAVYAPVCDAIVAVTTPEAAELAKLLENVFRSVNIALVNELAVLCERMGLDVWEVVDAAATKPYGFMRFEPGPGMGGHCLPVDPFYLSWRAREFDVTTEFIELAGKVNQQMPHYCVQRVERALNARGLPVRGTKVAVLGVAYKPGIGDLRESPALKIVALLQGLGAEVVYHDPFVPELPVAGLRSAPFPALVEDAALAVVVTAHREIDIPAAVERCPAVLDLRGVTRGIDAPHVERL